MQRKSRMAGESLFKKLLAAGAVLGAFVGAVACGPEGNSLLGGDPLNPNGGSGSDAGNGGWNNNSTYNADGAPQAPLAQQLFQALQPQLDQKCGGACHPPGKTLNARQR